MINGRSLIAAVGGAMLVAAVLFAAIGPSGTEEAVDDRVDMGFQRFLEMARSLELDYEPAATPSDLAERVDGVFIGRIVGVQPGQSYATVQGGEAVFTTSVLEVEVSEEIVGSSGQTPEGSAYLQIRHPAFVGRGSEGEARRPYDLDAFAETVPIGAPVVLFVYDITDLVEPDLIIDEGAGRPRRATLLSSAVQGFWVDPTGRDLTSVFESVEAMGDGWARIGSLDDLEAEIHAPH